MLHRTMCFGLYFILYLSGNKLTPDHLSFVMQEVHQSWFWSLFLSGKQLTLDDIGCVFEEVLDVSAQWYPLGLQLKLRTRTLDRIYAQFRGDPRDQLRETLKTWLTTSEYPSWRTLTDALRSRSVGATQLAGDLETKYCPWEGTDVDIGTFASDN